MRKLFIPFAAALGLMVGAGPASAVVLQLQSASFQITLATLAPIVVPWSGTGSADVTLTGGNISSIAGLTAGIFALNGTTPITDPAAAPIKGLRIDAATGVGNFAGTNTGAGGGLMAVIGTAKVCLFTACPGAIANVVVPFTTGGVNGVGLGGNPIAAPGIVNVTVSGNGWTTGAACIGAFCDSGSAANGLSVTLVTPTFVSTDIGASAALPLFGKMTLTFAPAVVPEPGTLLLLGSGVAGIALLGRKRMGK